jgi:outer membrane biogenesis lipoprotein LolB
MLRIKRMTVLALFIVSIASMALAGCSGDKGSDPATRPMSEPERQQHKEKAGGD